MKFVLKLMAFLAAVLSPVQDILIALMVFCGIDLITGVWKVIKTKTPFSSRKFAQSVGKIALYFMAVLTARICDIYFDLPKIENIVIGLIVITEVTSIMENISEITGIPIIERIQTLFKRQKPNENK
jgi:phage-related holin